MSKRPTPEQVAEARGVLAEFLSHLARFPDSKRAAELAPALQTLLAATEPPTDVLDLSNPEYREALRWAADVAANYPRAAQMILEQTNGAIDMKPLDSWLRVLAFRALSSPAESAAIVRALLEGCEVSTHEHHEEDWDGECQAEIVLRFDGGTLEWSDYEASYPIGSVHALILRLLSAATREEALAALREVGR